MLGLGYSNGTTLVFDVNNGKRIHNIGAEAPGFAAVSCMGWIDNHSHARAGSAPAEAKAAECTPQVMCDLDISSMLPRLSTLPSSAGPESTFTSKTTLDALINAVSKGGEGTHLDLMLIGDTTGKILVKYAINWRQRPWLMFAVSLNHS